MAQGLISPPKETSNLRWFQGVSSYAWLVLIVCALGWLFDCMDGNLFTLVRQKSLNDLLQPHYATEATLNEAVNRIGGIITSVFLLGWAAGGFIFGVLGDKLGRTRTMMITILVYAGFTGLNALVHEPWQYAACRFLTALGIGGEFAAGAALVAEVWPARSRPMALGTLQALSAVGNIMAAVITYVLAGITWRWVFVIGALPALMVLIVRLYMKEPEAWTKAEQQAKASGTPRELGNMADLFRDPVLRRNTIAGILIGIAGVGGLWGVVFFMPDFLGRVLAPAAAHLSDSAAKKQLQEWRSQAFFVQQVGALLGMFAYAALSERMGRRPSLALFFGAVIVVVLGSFWNIRDITGAMIWSFFLGFCALAPFSAFAVYFPELFPTRLRATGVGMCYNSARVISALAPSALGFLASLWKSPTDPAFGFRVAASIVASVYLIGFIGLAIGPETRGKPLPE
ncbi:MAG: MFS transporter [Armatimonadetes bacterium]|nr:MFS transporter [Armatimonadota bacterium]